MWGVDEKEEARMTSRLLAEAPRRMTVSLPEMGQGLGPEERESK